MASSAPPEEFPFPKWEELAGTAYWYSPIVYAANAGNVAALKKMWQKGFNICGSWCVCCEAQPNFCPVIARPKLISGSLRSCA